MNEPFFSGSAKLRFHDSGSGLPLVFLHPTPLDHRYWLPLVGLLPGIRAIAPDFRGHGASQLGDNLPTGGFSLVPDAPELSMAQLAQDTLALMDHLGIRQALFAGCSIGGYVLMELWRQAPERMLGMAIVCSKPQPDADANRRKRAATIDQARSGALDAIFDGNAQTLIGATARARAPQMVAELRSHMTLTAQALVAVQAGLATRPDSVSTVANLTVPILAIAGGEDPVISADEMRVFQSALGDCDFHLIPDAGHFAAYEQPAAVAALFTPWLRQFHS
ncbi:MAG TPA: alpha/beta fold hydrolase [Terracidiphilus sp.]|nr:alpha/beta fold hydrolase [Terracidiphilus sp.]